MGFEVAYSLYSPKPQKYSFTDQFETRTSPVGERGGGGVGGGGGGG